MKVVGMKSGFVICSVWLLFVYGSCSFSFVEKNQRLKVSSPENLKGTYECAISNLGNIPQHGGTLTGVVVYPQVNLMGCRSFSDYQLSFKTKTLGSLPVLLLVDRGDCYFNLKALNAQNAGAAGILIADDHLEHLTSYLRGEILPDGDDYSENITIPSALISSSIGNSMKEALYNGDFVRVNLEWGEDYEFEGNVDDNYDDQTEEQVIPMWDFIIKPTTLWGILVRNMWRLLNS